MKAFWATLGIFILQSWGTPVLAQSYFYPAIRFVSPYSKSLGGVVLPLTQDIGNALFNNPASLAKSGKFKAEFLNLDLDANSSVLSGLGLSTPKILGLGGMTQTLNSNPNKTYSAGVGNLTALAWGGFGVGILFQDRVRAYSDGTNVHYQTLNQFIPAIGYGLGLARGVVRLGYSLQYVNETSGLTQSLSDSSASYVAGVSRGHGFSHNLSVNFAFPFTYLPTFSLIGRNLGGLHFSGGSLGTSAKNSIGYPSDEDMVVDAAFNIMVRVSGSVKSQWYLQFKDLTGNMSLPFMERISFGIDLGVSESFGIRGGFNGSQFSLGLGYQSKESEINLAWYHDRNPFSNLNYWDTRYALQYKVYFQSENQRDRSKE